MVRAVYPPLPSAAHSNIEATAEGAASSVEAKLGCEELSVRSDDGLNVAEMETKQQDTPLQKKQLQRQQPRSLLAPSRELALLAMALDRAVQLRVQNIPAAPALGNGFERLAFDASVSPVSSAASTAVVSASALARVGVLFSGSICASNADCCSTCTVVQK
jgi:hypothetical protein